MLKELDVNRGCSFARALRCPPVVIWSRTSRCSRKTRPVDKAVPVEWNRHRSSAVGDVRIQEEPSNWPLIDLVRRTFVCPTWAITRSAAAIVNWKERSVARGHSSAAEHRERKAAVPWRIKSRPSAVLLVSLAFQERNKPWEIDFVESFLAKHIIPLKVHNSTINPREKCKSLIPTGICLEMMFSSVVLLLCLFNRLSSSEELLGTHIVNDSLRHSSLSARLSLRRSFVTVNARPAIRTPAAGPVPNSGRTDSVNWPFEANCNRSHSDNTFESVILISSIRAMSPQRSSFVWRETFPIWCPFRSPFEVRTTIERWCQPIRISLDCIQRRNQWKCRRKCSSRTSGRRLFLGNRFLFTPSRSQSIMFVVLVEKAGDRGCSLDTRRQFVWAIRWVGRRNARYIANRQSEHGIPSALTKRCEDLVECLFSSKDLIQYLEKQTNQSIDDIFIAWDIADSVLIEVSLVLSRLENHLLRHSKDLYNITPPWATPSILKELRRLEDLCFYHLLYSPEINRLRAGRRNFVRSLVRHWRTSFRTGVERYPRERQSSDHEEWQTTQNETLLRGRATRRNHISSFSLPSTIPPSPLLCRFSVWTTCINRRSPVPCSSISTGKVTEHRGEKLSPPLLD